MTNSTVWAIANKALLGMGLVPISSAAQYTSGIPTLSGYSPINGLDKYQQQCIVWLDILQSAVGLVMTKRFMWRKFQITTANNAASQTLVNVYQINNVVIEGFRANSIFNVTYGAGPGNPLYVVPYETFMRMFARPDLIPIGTPLWLVPLPDDGSGNCLVQLVPTPDQTYTIEGQCRLVVPRIVSGNDLCIFPYMYEHALVAKLIELLETRVDEGRDMTARAYAEQWIAEVIRDAGGADEEQDQIDLGFKLWNRWRSESARDYNPTTDVAPPYP